MGRPGLLNLSRHVSERNVRKKIFSHLHSYDIELVMCAHNTKRGFAFNPDFSLFCAEHGYISLMQWALQYQCPWDYDAAVVAAQNGHIEFLKWATLNTHMSRSSDAITEFVKRDDLDSMEWLISNGYPICQSSSDEAALRGNKKLLKWCMERGAGCGGKTAENAAQGKHYELLKWLRRKHLCHVDTRAIKWIVVYDDVQILQWCYDNGCTFNNNVLLDGVAAGSIATAKWLKQNGVPVTHQALVVAAGHGHLNCVEWMIDECNLMADTTVWEVAAQKGQYHVIEWAVARGYGIHSSVLSCALAQGNMLMIRFLMETCGIGIDPHCAFHAAESQSHEVIDYLLERCHKRDLMRFTMATSEHGNLELLKYCHQNDIPLDPYAFYAAARKGHIHVLGFLLDKEYEVYPFDSAGWPPKTIEFLEQQGAVFNNDFVHIAYKR